MTQKPLNSICILRLSALGDVCHAVAMVERIQRHWPKCQITWVIGKVERMLVGDIPGVEFVEYDKKQGFAAWKQLRRRFKGRVFDALLHMQVAARASLVSLAIPARVKIGFDKARAKEGQWLFTNRRIQPQTSPHVLDGFMAFADAIGVPQDEAPCWHIPLSEGDTTWAKEHIQGEFAVVISPAASKAERNWLAERYAQVADYLAAKGATLYLCGGPSPMEQELASEITRHAQCDITNLVGKTNLKQMLAALGQASLVIAPDTGPAHMAVTQGTPVVGLYAHSNPGRTGPYLYTQYVASVYDEVITQQQEQTQDKIAWGTRAKGGDLMAKISVEQVQAQLDKAIADFSLLSDARD